MKSQAQKLFCLGVGIALVVFLAGCEEATQSHDFNELIPRLMKPVNTYSNPMDAAANLFNVTSPDERRDAIAYLETRDYGHQPPYMKAYYVLSTDPHAMVRAQVMRALGSSHQNEAVPYLVDGATPAKKTGLNDPEPEVRRDAARGLQDTFDDTAIPALAEHLLKDSDDLVRAGCAMALKNGHTPAAYLALINALDDRSAAVVYYARQSLMQNTGQNLGWNARPWLAWYQQTYAQPGTSPATAPSKG